VDGDINSKVKIQKSKLADFICYRKYGSLEEAEAVASILKENEIPFSIGNNRGVFDKTFIGSTVDNMVELNIPAHLFTEADTILINFTLVDIDTLPNDYYLLSFTDEELKDILRKSDEWSEQNYLIAKQLLAKRGFDYTNEDLTKFKSERVVVLAKPEKAATNWILGGYAILVLYLVIGAVVIGFMAVLIGYTTWRMKKVLPNGSRIFMYNSFSRKQGMLYFFSRL
jgi:hypothetical protein